jgi:hypothetical protein
MMFQLLLDVMDRAYEQVWKGLKNPSDDPSFIN